MDYFAGLDVSVKETSVCIVDDTGKIVREVKVASEPAALLVVLKNPAYHFKRVGLEAGPLSQWLFSALAEASLPVICVETRHMRAVLKAQINKTDRNDARGIAQMMRVGLYRLVHVKTLRSQKLRMLLTHRKLLQSKAIAIDNDLRGTLRNFGLKVGIAGTVKFEARIRELVENLPDLAALVEPLLIVRRTLREQFCILHRRLLAIVRDDEVCRRWPTWPISFSRFRFGSNAGGDRSPMPRYGVARLRRRRAGDWQGALGLARAELGPVRSAEIWPRCPCLTCFRAREARRHERDRAAGAVDGRPGRFLFRDSGSGRTQVVIGRRCRGTGSLGFAAAALAIGRGRLVSLAPSSARYDQRKFGRVARA